MEAGAITSAREAVREIEADREVALRNWAKDHIELFPTPTTEEALFVKEIFAVRHFRQVIERKKFLKGGNAGLSAFLSIDRSPSPECPEWPRNSGSKHSR